MKSLLARISLGLGGLLALSALPASPHALPGQNEQADVPGDLVRAILARQGEDPVILPGVAPELVTASIEIPGNWRILGSVVYRSSSAVYLQAVGSSESVRQLLRDRLFGKGWSAPEPIRRGGFVPAETATPLVFCGPGGQLMTVGMSERAEGPVLSIAVQERLAATPCDRAQVVTSSFSELNDRMPVLSIPEGRVRSSGLGGGGRNTAYSGIELETTLGPADIADRVSADLVAAGWILDAATVGDVSLVRTWSREFEGGFRAHGQLLIITIESGKYDVTFQMTRLSDR